MMKQARNLLSRSLCDSSKSLFEGNFRASALRRFASSADSSGNKNAATPGGRMLAPYAIFKGRAALSVEPVFPGVTAIGSGDLGCVMMTFMPAVGERKYDWGNRQMFALAPMDVGSLISMDSKDSSEFFDDSSINSSNDGQVKKSLSIKPHANGSGYFFSLNVNANDRLVVPVTTAEFTVLKTAFSFALPHIMGWGNKSS